MTEKWKSVSKLGFHPLAAKSLQSCLTLCNPIDGSPPVSPVPGILQARTLEWVAISFSNAWKWKVKVKSLSRVQLFMTPWIAAYQAPPSMGFPRQEYWSGVPFPSPGDLLDPGIELASLAWQADSFITESHRKPHEWGPPALLTCFHITALLLLYHSMHLIFCWFVYETLLLLLSHFSLFQLCVTP